jgi:Ca-activated chloride channel family protein
MTNYRRPFWRYSLFQIPAIFLGICLAAALLFWLLGFGRPPVAVAIALDLSSSTYSSQFNEPGSVMAREVEAVQAYLEKNTPDILRQPNQVQVFGFADGVTPLTSSFQTDTAKVAQELNQSLQPDLTYRIGGGTNVDLAIQEGSKALSSIEKRCRELLIVTDGQVSVNPSVITQARKRRVKVNSIVLGTNSLDLRLASLTTGGRYVSGDVSNLNLLFTDKFFQHFNSNWRWIMLWLGLAWIFLMWMVTMPLDRWIFQGLLKIRFDFSGRLALGNALFWTVATPLILWQIYSLFNWALPFLSQC